MNSPCREHELDALLTDELSPSDAARVRAHAEGCAACAQSLAWLKLERGWMAQRARRASARPALDFSALEARLAQARAPSAHRPPRRGEWTHRGKMALAAAAAVSFVMFSLSPSGPLPSSSESAWDGETLLFTPARAEVCVDPGIEAVAALEASVGACLLASPVLAVR
jgi:anti-sigma factor RsiW